MLPERSLLRANDRGVRGASFWSPIQRVFSSTLEGEDALTVRRTDRGRGCGGGDDQGNQDDFGPLGRRDFWRQAEHGAHEMQLAWRQC